MPHWAGLILGQIPHCMELNVSQMPGDFLRGGEGWFRNDRYIIILYVYPKINVSNITTVHKLHELPVSSVRGK